MGVLGSAPVLREVCKGWHSEGRCSRQGKSKAKGPGPGCTPHLRLRAIEEWGVREGEEDGGVGRGEMRPGILGRGAPR